LRRSIRRQHPPCERVEASLPVIGLLANNHLGERGLFAYLSSGGRLAAIYVPFVTSTAARSVQRHRAVLIRVRC
jgi:hypothetical protein